MEEGTRKPTPSDVIATRDSTKQTFSQPQSPVHLSFEGGSSQYGPKSFSQRRHSSYAPAFAVPSSSGYAASFSLANSPAANGTDTAISCSPVSLNDGLRYTGSPASELAHQLQLHSAPGSEIMGFYSRPGSDIMESDILSWSESASQNPGQASVEWSPNITAQSTDFPEFSIPPSPLFDLDLDPSMGRELVTGSRYPEHLRLGETVETVESSPAADNATETHLPNIPPESLNGTDIPRGLIPFPELRKEPIINTNLGATHFAAFRGNVDLLRVYIDSNAIVDLSAVTAQQRTALHIAVENGHVEVVRCLLNLDRSINIGLSLGDVLGWTPLHIAARHGYQEIIALLLDAGADVKSVTKSGKTAVHIAIAYDHTEVANELLAREPLLASAKDNRAWTPLHEAAARLNNPVAWELFKSGAAPNALGMAFGEKVMPDRIPTWDKFEILELVTPLHILVKLGSILYASSREEIMNKWGKSMVELFLHNGADINKRSSRGRTLLHLTSRDQFHEILLMFLQKDASGVNLIDERGSTPLHYAVHHEMVLSVSVLLAFGADTNLVNALGYSPLLVATLQGNLEIMKALLDHGADANIRTSRGHDALLIASLTGSVAATELLLKYGAIGNAATTDGHFISQSSMDTEIQLLRSGMEIFHEWAEELFPELKNSASEIEDRSAAVDERSRQDHTPNISQGPSIRASPLVSPNLSPSASPDHEHPPPQLFSCRKDNCNRQYTDRQNRNRHERSFHAPNPKSYNCSVPGCGKRFTRKDNLSKHVETQHGGNEAGNSAAMPAPHEPERPFACELCSATFSNAGYLDRHMRTGHNVYSCDLCTKSFFRELTLDRHKRDQHGN